MSGYKIELNPRVLRKLGAGGMDEEGGKHLAEAMARILVDAIKDSMEEAPARSGRTYLVPGTRTPYTASAPGEPPAVRTARYRDAWEPTKGVREGDRVVAFAVNALRTESGELVGFILEDGRGNIAPRPHIREAIPEARRRIAQLIRRIR